ncbi:MAG: NAD(P)-binding domain-containing protein, partial [Moorella sp. (in: Bacteria)]|nr:NAD(P)-binding domain-containing protein [Moorella sp. (in: firmicutes)]
MRVGIIGTGAVGTGMGLLLSRRGYMIAGVASRTLASARRAAARLGCQVFEQPEEVARQAEVVFITTSDQAIGPVAARVAARGGFSPGQTVIH